MFKNFFLIRVYNKPCGMQIISIVELREVRDQLKKASELERIRNVNIALLWNVRNSLKTI